MNARRSRVHWLVLLALAACEGGDGSSLGESGGSLNEQGAGWTDRDCVTLCDADGSGCRLYCAVDQGQAGPECFPRCDETGKCVDVCSGVACVTWCDAAGNCREHCDANGPQCAPGDPACGMGPGAPCDQDGCKGGGPKGGHKGGPKGGCPHGGGGGWGSGEPPSPDGAPWDPNQPNPDGTWGPEDPAQPSEPGPSEPGSTEPVACTTDVMGGPTSCKDAGTWKLYAWEQCMAQGLDLADYGTFDDCGEGLTRYVKYACCGPTPPPPPSLCAGVDCPAGTSCQEQLDCPGCASGDPACMVPCKITAVCIAPPDASTCEKVCDPSGACKVVCP